MPEAAISFAPSAKLRVLPGGAAASTPGGVRIFLVGADALARAGVVSLLGSHDDITLIGDEDPGPRAVAALRTHRPDVLVLHGLRDAREVAALLEDVDPQLPVLTVGGCEPDARTAPALHGHLPATTTARQLAAAVALAAAGYALTRSPLPAVPGPPARPRATTRVSDVRPDALTGREGQVLDLVARGLSNTEIAGSLTLSEHTVKTHVQNLLHKLHLRNRVQVAIYAFETGLR
ncbi:Response regulator protein VraR [Streptomyces sp. YIM 130001]|uniref:response regulator transcription factor n=1 Tax=Streptomyces sp. YIM 130001 TaxID=2259644 RepID=UPI000E64DEB1|nr:response regulator transcription factor [Streptomyces sp. YIM 130001]RII13422.1 Response regulator protein VraR [Streptomyces sp. YIM 130001]